MSLPDSSPDETFCVSSGVKDNFISRMKHKTFHPGYIFLFFSQLAFAAIEDPCAGASLLINLVNRPTRSDSACTVPFKQGVIETGYQYVKFMNGIIGQNYPEAILRIGLPQNHEVVVLLPNYNTQSVTPHSGYSPTIAGWKHELGYNEKWLATIETLVTFPSGGNSFGTNHYDGALNAITNYKITNQITWTMMLGVTSQSLPPNSGSTRFVSFNPDGVLSWAPTEKLDFYFEVFGQTKTAPGQGSGFIANGGILYLLTPNIEIDAEYGHKLYGKLSSVISYYGAGISFLIS